MKNVKIPISPIIHKVSTEVLSVSETSLLMKQCQLLNLPGPHGILAVMCIGVFVQPLFYASHYNPVLRQFLRTPNKVTHTPPQLLY